MQLIYSRLYGIPVLGGHKKGEREPLVKNIIKNITNARQNTRKCD
jgi:hypothetical protein